VEGAIVIRRNERKVAKATEAKRMNDWEKNMTEVANYIY
jgi:hypothetical protein